MSFENAGLFGDGIQDDTPALQAMLDSGASLVYLPPPKVCYTVSATLYIHSGQELRLDRYTVIRLMDNRDCVMLENSDPVAGNRNITVTGGIWDLNGGHQRQSPFQDGTYVKAIAADNWDVISARTYHNSYSGVGMRYCNVTDFRLADLTLKDAASFGVQMALVNRFSVENITFDYLGNPRVFNKDGIHLDGCCRFGFLRNLKGACHDDLVALNADDLFPQGPIEDIVIDGIFAEDCHSAVRLLTYKSWIRNIHITNVYGTYYQYCIGLSKCYGTKLDKGLYDHIAIDHIYASKAPRYSKYERDGEYVYAVIWIESGLDIRSLHLSDICRTQPPAEPHLVSTVAVPTVLIMKDAEINRLCIEHMRQDNLTGIPFPMILNDGTIQKLRLVDLCAGDDEPVKNRGTIEVTE
jgi:hypothetical protein